MTSTECVDCKALGEPQPGFPEGESPRCHWHRAERARHQGRERARAARQGSNYVRREYLPRPLADIVDERLHDRRITPKDVQDLGGLIADVRATKDQVQTWHGARAQMDPEVVGRMLADLGVLLDELDKLLWPNGKPQGWGKARPRFPGPRRRR